MTAMPTARRSTMLSTGLTLGEISDWLGGEMPVQLTVVAIYTPQGNRTEYSLSLTPEQYHEIIRYAGLPPV